ncbi:hypothetical protein GCM10010282_51360 [Streptomyces roseolus]|nr:hypothetical protein GCM10010282_51360 [Streptomyces roseolus]
MNSWQGRIVLAAKALAVFGPALVPIAANLTAITAAASAMGVSVGAAVGIYGAAMKGAITNTQAAQKEISALRSELDKQKAVLATLKPGTEAYANQLKKVAATQKELDAALKALSPSQRSFIQATDSMSAAWKKFITSTQDKTLATATNVVKGLTSGIGLLKPILDAVHPSLLKVSKDFAEWMKGDSARNYANLIKASAVPALQDLITAGKDVINVLGDGFRAFLPHGVALAQKLREGAAALKEWSDGGGFQRFLQYVRDTAPQVREFFQALGDALKNIGTVMRELAPVSLGLITVFLKVIAAIPPDLLQALVIGFMAWRAAVLLVNAAMLLLNANPIVLVITAIIAAIYLLVTNWETVSNAFKTAWNATWNFIKQVAETIWNGLKTAWQAVCNAFTITWNAVSGAISTAWNTVWNALRTAAATVWNAIKTAWQAICNSFSIIWSTVGGALSAAWNTVWNALRTAAETVWNALKAAWNAFIQGLQTIWTTVSGALSSAWNTVWNAIRTAAEAVWNALRTAWNAFVQGLQTIWSTVSGALSSAWNTVWNAIKTAAEAVWNALRTAWNAFIQGLQTIWTTVSGALSTAWNTVWNALRTAAEAVWNALRTAWNAFIQGLQTIWSTVSAALSTAWNTAWNAIRTVATTIWTALQTAWQAFLTAVQSIWTTVSGALSTAWNTVWNAIKTAAETIWNALKVAWEAFLNAVKTVWDTVSAALRTAWETIWNAIKTVAETIWNAIKVAWEAFLNAVKSLWDTVSEALKSVWEAVWNWIRETAQRIWDEVKQRWDDFINGIKELWDTVSETLKSAWETAWNWLKDTAQKIWHEIGEIIEKAVNGIIGIINGIIGAWNKISGAVGLDSLNIGEIPTVSFNFATGGVVEFANGGIAGGMPHFKAGGVLPGYAPGRDTVPAMLSRGEGILVPEAVKALGPDFVHWANFTFSHGRGGKNVAFPGYAKGGIARGCELNHYAGGGIVAFGRDPRNKEGWGTHFFQGGGVVDPDNPGTVGPGGIIIGGEASTSPDAADVKVGDGDPLGVGVITGGIENMMKTGGMVLGFLGRAAIEAAFAAIMKTLEAFGEAGDFGKLLVAGTKKILTGMIDNLVKKDEEAKQQFTAMSVAGTQSVQGWAPLAAKALQIAGLDPSQLQRFLALMMAESGGNPNAFNGWDINAKNGVPSQGLMQVIPTTFAAYRDPSLSNNILDPLANMVASANYIQARYGGQVPGSPYADGTTSATAGLHLVGEEGPELVTSPGYANFGGGETVYDAADTAALMSGPSTGRGGIEASLKNRSFEEIVSAAKWMAANVKASWGNVVYSSTSGWTGLRPVLGDVAMGHGGTVPDSMEVMRSKNASAWADMNLQSATQWALMRDTTLNEASLQQGVTLPAATAAMQNASNTAWNDMGFQSATQWAAMRDTTFAESNLMQTSTMPASAVAMQTASGTAWNDMALQSSSQWTAMNDSAFTPLQSTMTTEVPGAANTMNTGVSSESKSMATNVISAVESTMGPVDSFISKMDSAIAKANQAATAIRSAVGVAAGGGSVSGGASAGSGTGGASSGLSAALNQAAANNDMLLAGGWTPLDDGTWMAPSGGGTAAQRRAADQAAANNDMLLAAGYKFLDDGTWSRFAEGTPSAPRGLALVGEEGPELLNFHGGESVTPAGETASLLSGANVPMITEPAVPEGGGVPQDAAIQSPMLEQMQQFTAPPEAEGWFGEIIAAAQHMLTTAQTAWDGTVAAGVSAQPAITATTTAVGTEVGVQIPAQLEAMAASAAANWAAMTATGQANWAAQLATVYTPAETHMGTTMPAMSLAMQTAHDLAWTTMNATSLATWTIMRDVQYLEAETHMGTTMPQMAVAMQTAHDLAWTTMNATSLATWTIMRDTQYLEAETHMGTTMPQMAVTMQTAHDLAWTTMQATSLAQWTLIRDGQILPFEEHMQTTMPAAAQAMNEAVSAAFTTMVETIVAQLDTAIAKIEEFIAATEAAIAAAEALAAAQAAAAASGGGGGGAGGGGVNGGSDLEAALARAGNPQVIQGPYSDGSLSAGTHTGGGVVDVPVSAFDAMIAAGFIGWIRSGPAWAGNEHAHMILPGAPDLSPQARWQVQDYYAGGSGLGIPGNLARGSNNAPPGWTWVGEAGPELLRMRGGEEVMPHLASSMFASGLRRRRGWNPKKSQFFRSDGGRREFTSLMEASAGSVRGSVSDGGGINVEFTFNGPVSNGEDVRRAVDEAIPKLRTALQAGTGRRIGG